MRARSSTARTSVDEPAGAPSAWSRPVTETWTDLRHIWPDWAAAILDKTATGGRLFSDFQRRDIKRTFSAMKADFESGYGDR